MSFDLYSLRRELHRIPETAFSEQRTKALLLEQLSRLDGITVHQFQNSPGLLVEYSHGEGGYRLFRADMDALPIAENTACGFESENPGVMHACGHDVHMTVLLGLIDRIAEHRAAANLLFLFQPAEEGQGGAESVLSEGLIQSFGALEAYALHVASGLPVGSISSRAGLFFGIPQEFDITFQGRAAHAAFPEQGVDALLAGAEFLRLIHAAVAELAASERVICHIGKLNCGIARNIVSDRCVIEGTLRTLSKQAREQAQGLILQSCAAAADKLGAEFRVDWLGTYDPVVNSPELTERLERACTGLGLDYQEAEIALTGEDFGFFTTLYPSLLFWLGAGCGYPLHSDRFLAEEACIPIGVSVFERLALS